MPREAFRVVHGRDMVTEHASSPGVVRAFCKQCGTPLFYDGEAQADRVYVPVAILDAIDRPVDSHVSYEERAPWVAGMHTLPCFEGKSDKPLRAT